MTVKRPHADIRSCAKSLPRFNVIVIAHKNMQPSRCRGSDFMTRHNTSRPHARFLIRELFMIADRGSLPHHVLVSLCTRGESGL